MISPAEVKNIPVFRRESIAAMTLLEREVASEMEQAGWIRIIDAPEGGKP